MILRNDCQMRVAMVLIACLTLAHAESEEIVDIGPSFPGDVRTALVAFTNTDAERWTVEKITVGCNCAQATSSVRAVESGGKLPVQIGFQARLQVGQERLRVTVGYSVGGQRKERTLVATTNIVDFVRAENRVHLSEVSVLDTILTPSPDWRADWDRMELAGSPAWCAVEMIEEDGEYRLRARINDINYGVYAGQVRVRFLKNGSKLNREQVIPVKGVKSGALKMVPGTLMLGTVYVGEQTAFKLAFTEGDKANARAIQVRQPEVSVVHGEIQELGGRQVLSLKVGPASKVGTESGTLFVRDSHGAELRVPFVVLFANAYGR